MGACILFLLFKKLATKGRLFIPATIILPEERRKKLRELVKTISILGVDDGDCESDDEGEFIHLRETDENDTHTSIYHRAQ